ncbi:MAG TPA: methyl-accepting chemotaxis protein, partial [Candidatus Paceibacterota bacterium]|nr:methyl-accepting chemotaxis protein [Candidatus Paceibacterota bacterium]
MKSWTIGKRITVGFTGVIAISLSVGTISWFLADEIQQSSHLIRVDCVPGSIAMGAVNSSLNEHLANANVAVLHPSADVAGKARQRLAETSAGIQKVMDEYAATMTCDEDRVNFAALKSACDSYQGVVNEALIARNNATSPDEVMNKLARLAGLHAAARLQAEKLLAWNTDRAMKVTEEIDSDVVRTKAITAWGLAIGASVAVGFGWFIVRGVRKALCEIATVLREGAEQTASAANQVNCASQALASGASEQAACHEQTCSSLEQMSSMTAGNAENSQKSNDLARQTRAAADKGAEGMKTMSLAMSEIKTSSDDVAKIIRTIDEIAFQTNILALN